MCVDSIKLGLDRRVASSWDRAVYLINHMALVMSICNFGCFPFWYLLLITPTPGHCLPFTFQQN